MKKVLLIVAALCAMSGAAFAQCATMPCVVATTSLTNQREGIAPTILYTPATEGTFRINMYMSTTAGPRNAGQWEVFFRWTDNIAMRKINMGAQNGSTSVPFGTIVVHDLAGQPLVYRTVAVDGRDIVSKRYDLYIVVEQLQ